MRRKTDRRGFVTAAISGLYFLSGVVSVSAATTLRVVNYNIDADTGGGSGQMGGPTAGPGMSTVLQGIGNEHLQGNAQPIDVLALEELYGSDPTTTLSYVASQLNALYGAGTYAYDTAGDPTTGPTGTGNGPSGLIYNTHTVQDVAAVAIGTISGTGAARAPMRYTLRPIGYGSNANLYLYVSHAKSGSASDISTGTTTDGDRRQVEMSELRSDANSLGSAAHVVYAGDFNVDDSSETAYQTMVSTSLDGGVGAGNDIPNPANNWTDTGTYANILTESATSLNYRDDFQFVTSPAINQPGVELVLGSYATFGNNGTTAKGSSTNLGSNSALSDLPNRSAVLSALTTVTDHLPIVADYSVVGVSPIPEPGTAGLLLVCGILGLKRRSRKS